MDRPSPVPPRPGSGACLSLFKGVEDAPLRGRVDADAGVCNGISQDGPGVCFQLFNTYGDTAGICELDRVPNDVYQYLVETEAVCLERLLFCTSIPYA